MMSLTEIKAKLALSIKEDERLEPYVSSFNDLFFSVNVTNKTSDTIKIDLFDRTFYAENNECIVRSFKGNEKEFCGRASNGGVFVKSIVIDSSSSEEQAFRATMIKTVNYSCVFKPWKYRSPFVVNSLPVFAYGIDIKIASMFINLEPYQNVTYYFFK